MERVCQLAHRLAWCRLMGVVVAALLGSAGVSEPALAQPAQDLRVGEGVLFAEPPSGFGSIRPKPATYRSGAMLARAVPNPPAWRPFADLPAFPITHVSLVLGAVALLLLARRAGAMVLAQGAIKRGARPALIMLLYVLLARWMGESGATASLAREAAAALGPLAPYAVPPLGLMAGMVTGTNVGSNAAMMPVQYKLGLAAGLPPMLAPGVHNFVGAAGAGMSFAVTAMICGLLADGTKPAALWRLLWPSLVAVLVIGWGAMALLI